jgi:hypothetical protein
MGPRSDGPPRGRPHPELKQFLYHHGPWPPARWRGCTPGGRTGAVSTPWGRDTEKRGKECRSQNERAYTTAAQCRIGIGRSLAAPPSHTTWHTGPYQGAPVWRGRGGGRPGAYGSRQRHGTSSGHVCRPGETHNVVPRHRRRSLLPLLPLLPHHACHRRPPASSPSPVATLSFPQCLGSTPCRQHTRGWRHGRGGGVPGPRQGSALAGAARLRQCATTARPGPRGTGAAHAAASAPRAPRQTGSRASVVRPRYRCHD